ncbi:MAG: hypothetical protein ACO23H_12295 [Alphaproteobacteria bacterium]
MSNVVIQGDASGTGNFTIAAPNSNTDRSLTLPDEAGTLLTNNDKSLAKFWIKVDQTGTVTNLASYNVTSITDTGTGILTVNIDTDFSSAEYCVGMSGQRSATLTAAGYWNVGTMASGTIEVRCYDNGGSPQDYERIYVWGFGDQ